MLTGAQREAFHGDGLVRLPAAVARADAEAMQARLWERLAARDGVVRDAPETWRTIRPAGFRALTKAGAFAALASPAVRVALDDLLGHWHAAACWGQPLVTFPTPGVRWGPRATEWHVDLFVIPGNPLPCVKLLALLAPLEPAGGGTLVVTGSHRLAMQLAAERGETREPLCSADLRRRLARADPWLATLWRRDGGEDRCKQLMEGGACVGGVELRLAEVTGAPGDVFLMHPYALHAASPNVRDRPRMMLAQQVNRRSGDAPT